MNIAKYFLSFFVAKEVKDEEFVIVDAPKAPDSKRLESDSSDEQIDQKLINRKNFQKKKKYSLNK